MILLLIALFSLVALVALHELGHFFLARIFGVKVEEFGFGLPPRLFGKKIGETLYSLNLLPLGAFVRMLGEESAVQNKRSFSSKPIWQRALIVVAGVVAFWIISSLILASLAATSGIPAAVPDTFEALDARITITGVAPGSPAETAGIMPGDIILELGGVGVSRVSEVQRAVESSVGTSLELSLMRGGVEETHSALIREEAPSGQGLLGVSLARTTFLKYPWYEAPARGVILSFQLTLEIARGIGDVVASLFRGQGGGVGAQIMGPIGIIQLLSGSLESGLPSFLYFLSLLSLYLALFNILPIPVVDGGRLLFLGIEALRKRPIPQAIEQRIHGVFFALLIGLLIWASIQDITRIF